MDSFRSRFGSLIAIQRSIGNAGGDLQSVMDAIVSEPSVMPQSNGIVVELRDGDQLFYAAASGTSAGLIGLRLPLNSSLSGMSMLTGMPLYCEDSETDSRVNRLACRRVGLRSMIAVPIPHNGQMVGVLKYHSDKVAAYSEEDMLLAHFLVGPITVGLSSVAEADAIRAQNELRSILDMKEQLVATVSHELRTPLTSISGSLSLLESGAAGPLSESAKSMVSIATRNTKRLRRLVDDLLEADRLDAGKLAFNLSQVDLRDVISSVVSECLSFADQTNVNLTFDGPDEPMWIETDPERLAQAVTNIISNACKFSPAGSTVRVVLSRDRDGASIRVCDEGPGIPVNSRDRLFDRFTQLDHTRNLSELPGTGLGLWITRAIVERLGGRVRYVDDTSPGATFEINMPQQCPDDINSEEFVALKYGT